VSRQLHQHEFGEDKAQTLRVDGTVSVITGGSSGIGAATAIALALQGSRVVLLARRRHALARVVAEIAGAGGEATAYAVDLADAGAVERVSALILADIGAPQIVVHCAGVGRWLFVEETSPAEAAEMMAAPYFAAFHVTRAFLPAMLARSHGRFVFMCSPAARIVWPGATSYAAARWALQGFSEALRADLSGTGIGVMTVVASIVDDEYWIHNPGTRARIPKIARLAAALTPEQVAAAIVLGLHRDRRQIVLPGLLRLFYVAHHFCPRGVEWLVRVTGWRHPAAERGRGRPKREPV
jgi:short-subunit dehydrogenase